MADDPLAPQQEEPNLFLDVAAAPFRGILGAGQSVYDLADYFTADILPDIDIRFLGKSKTMAGGVVEGASQFLTGFIPVVGALGRAGQLAKAGSLAQKALGSSAARSAIAGVATDFTVFSEQEQRLSNLIQSYPELQNPVTEFLATQEDDSVIEGRLKNSLEGLGLGLMVDGLIRGIKAVKRGSKAKAEGGTPDEVVTGMREEFGDDPDAVINEAVRDVDPDPQAKVVDETTGEILEDAKPKEAEEKFEVELTEEGFENKTKGSRENYDESYQSFKDKLGNTGRGGRVNYNTTSTEDTFNILEAANKAVKDTEDVIDPAETIEETLSAGATEKAAREAAEELAPDQGKYYKDALKQAQGNVDDLKKIRRQITAFRLITEDIVGTMTDTFAKTGEYGVAKTKAVIAAQAENLYEFIAMDSRLARQFGKGLREVAIFRNKKSTVNNVEDLLLSDNTAAEAWLRDRKQEWIDKVVDIIQQGGDKNAVMKKILGITEASKGGKFDMLREMWINNLLSGIPTQTVNILGGVITTVLDTFEQTAGALLSGRPDIAKAALKTAFDLDSLREAMTWATKAAKKDQQFLIPNSDRSLDLRPRAAITPEGFDLTEGDALYGFVDKMGKVMRLPSRGLSSADEFFKQLNARRTAKYKASIEAIKEGIDDPVKIAEFVQAKVEKLISEGGEIYSERVVAREGLMEAKRRKLDQSQTMDFVQDYVKKNYDKDLGGLAEYAKDRAEELTFTKALDPDSLSGSFHKFVSKNPVMSFVFPFIRTPVNILKFAADRSALGLVNMRGMDDLMTQLRSSNPRIKAAARGRVATASAAVLATFPTFQLLSDRISGGGPRDPRKRKRLEDTGWQPYSIKIGDSYIAYQRLDPVATIIGVYADMNEMFKEHEFNVTDSGVERVITTLLVILQRNITNKSYLAGMEQFTAAMSDTSGRKAERFFGNVAANTAIPLAGFWRSTGREIVGEIMDQDDMKELRNTMDRVRQYDPSGSGFKLDPRRNILGEEKEIEAMFNSRFTNAVSPIRYKRDKQDVVMDEFAALNHSFSEPSPNYRGLINLTAYRNDKGQTAHDRRLELMGTVKIKGKTLRQALEKLITSKSYQKLSPRSEPALPSPRIKEVNKLLSRYRAEGFDRAIREFPELKDFYNQYREVQRQQKRGAELDNLIQTLNF